MREKAKKYLPILIFLLFVTVVFGWMTFHQVKLVDYSDHLGWTKKMAEEGYVYNLPHTLFAKSVIILRALIPYNLLAHLSNRLMSVVNFKSYDIAAIVLMIAAYIITTLVVWKKALKAFTDKEPQACQRPRNPGHRVGSVCRTDFPVYLPAPDVHRVFLTEPAAKPHLSAPAPACAAVVLAHQRALLREDRF